MEGSPAAAVLRLRAGRLAEVLESCLADPPDARSAQSPWVNLAALPPDRLGGHGEPCLPLPRHQEARRGGFQVIGSPVSMGPFVTPRVS